ncbi:MAG: hypothetical protein KKC03_06160 [Bacteroidetes bacterium]|nr:hypothetical protein [Bacteroidota bacterium]
MKDTTIERRSKHATLELTEKAGVITATCLCDSLQALVKQYETTIRSLRTELDQRQIPVITNELTAWQRIFYKVGLAVTLILAGAGIWRLISKRLNHG